MASKSSPEARAAIDVLRALLNVQKCPMSISILLKEYREMEGKILGFRNFGFKSAEEFLKSSGEFLVMVDRGEVLVGARPNKDSAHIVQMVTRQKPSRKRARKTCSTFKNRIPTKRGQSWDKTSYLSNVYRNLPSSNNVENLAKKIYKNDNRSNISMRPIQLVNSKQNPVSSTISSRLNFSKETQKCEEQKQIQRIVQPQSCLVKPSLIRKTELDTQKPVFNVKTDDHFIENSKTDTQTRSNDNISSFPKYIEDSNSCGEKNNLVIQTSSVSKNERVVSVYNECDLQIKFDNPPTLANKRRVLTFDKIINKVNVIKDNIINLNEKKQDDFCVKTDDPKNSIKPISNVEKNYGRSNACDVFKKDDLIKTLECSEQNKEVYPNVLTPPLSPLNNGLMQNTSNLSTNMTKNILNNNDPRKNLNISNFNTNCVVNANDKSKNEKYLKTHTLQTEKYEFNYKENPVTSLEQYCLARGYAEPKYDSKYYNGLLFSVIINGTKYTTYPKYFQDPQIAKNACAALAIDEIKIEERKIIKYPVCTDSDSNLLSKIYEEVKANHTSGIFIKMFSKFFESKFQQMLPHHWFSLIENSKYFSLESTVDTENTILVANLYPDDADNYLNGNDKFIMDSIVLPWENKYWNLYITHCVSTIEIWGRIIDKEYSQQLDSLLSDIDETMSKEITRPETTFIGQIYLVYISECWHRVRLERKNNENERCLCFFIDFGDYDWLLIDQLFACDKKFLKLPAQAVSFSLFGLEDFTENPFANKYLNETIMGSSLVAKIFTKQETYETKNDEINKIEIVLYDTSSNIDIIVNEVLVDKICAGTPIPELKPNSPTNVNITHITNSGDIYLQVLDSSFYYMQKLISQLIESKFQHDQYKVNLEELNLSNLYLISDNNNWYRGCLIDIDVKNRNAKEFKMFYVDYGYTKFVNISNIFCLESLSTALNRYPRQAIKTKMYNIPPANEFVLKKLKFLLPDNSLAIVKLAIHELSPNVVPHIIVFVRVENNRSLCNVNDAIRMEYELIANDLSVGVSDSSLKIELNSSPSMNPSKLEHEMLPIELHSNISIPQKGEIFTVLVTVASTPFDFYVIPYKDYSQFQNMVTYLQSQCQNHKEFISDDMIEPGEAYAAPLQDLYHRCIIERTLPNNKCYVYFCDHGNRDVIDITSLRPLPSKCRDLPTQAIKAKLHGIVPLEGNWSQKDNKRFYELTVGKIFVGVVKNILFDNFDSYRNSKVLELKLVDQPNDIIVHEILLEENRAILS